MEAPSCFYLMCIHEVVRMMSVKVLLVLLRELAVALLY